MVETAEAIWRYLESRIVGPPLLVLVGLLTAVWWFRRDVGALIAGSDPAHDVRRIQVTITAGAIGAALLHLLAPRLAIDRVTLILLAAAGVPWLVTLFKEIEFGGVKIKFRELEDAGRRAGAAGLLDLKPKAAAERRYSFEAVADNDPNLALAGLRIEIERRLTSLAVAAALPVERSGVSSLLRRLAEGKVLTREQRAVLDDLVGLLNSAAHGARVDSGGTAWALKIGPQLLATLDSLIAEQRSRALQMPTTRDVSVPSTTGHDELFSKLTRLRESGVQDPDVDLFLGVLKNDSEVVKSALEEGADVNVTDTELLRRYGKQLGIVH